MARKKRTVNPNWHWKPDGKRNKVTVKWAMGSEVRCWACNHNGLEIGWAVSLMKWVAKCPSCGVTGNASDQSKAHCAVLNTEKAKEV